MAMYDDIPDHRYRFIDNVGDAFLIGGGFGSAYHFVRAFRSSPGGGRLAAAVRAVCTNGPRVSGTFGAGMAVLCAFESAMSIARRRDDHWNSVVGGGASFGLLNMHRGAAAAARSALHGATIFAGIAGALLAFESWHGRLIVSGRECRMKGVLLPLPAVVPIKRVTTPWPADHGGDPPPACCGSV